MGKTPNQMLVWRSHIQFAPDMAWQPPLDVYETEEEIIIKVELAGIGVEDLEIAIERDVLTITGRREDPATTGEALRCVHHREIDCGRFERRVQLPARVSRESIEAKLRDGFLDIVLSKDLNRPRSYRIKVT